MVMSISLPAVRSAAFRLSLFLTFSAVVHRCIISDATALLEAALRSGTLAGSAAAAVLVDRLPHCALRFGALLAAGDRTLPLPRALLVSMLPAASRAMLC